MVMAQKDPKSGNLDRVQIVKGWLDAGGKQHEQVYDVVWSGDRKPGAEWQGAGGRQHGRPQDGAIHQQHRRAQLATVWKDPAFDPNQRAFYYARVLEIPTPRWSTRHAVELGLPIPAGLPVSIQERAWTSPIWYNPG